MPLFWSFQLNREWAVNISDEILSIYSPQICHCGGVYDEVQHKGYKRNESRCLLDTELYTQIKDGRQRLTFKKSNPVLKKTKQAE